MTRIIPAPSVEARFAVLAAWLSAQVGRSHTFAVVSLGTLAWLAADALGIVGERVNTFLGAFTGLVSLVLLVLLQNSANRGTIATNLKIDELIRAMPAASNRLMGAEELSEEELMAERERLRASDK